MASMYETVAASPEEVEAFADTLTPAYLRCRVWGHDPEPHAITLAKDVEGVPAAHWDATLRCSHGCGVHWTVLVSSDGSVLRRRLDYGDAPGYVHENGRIDKDGKKVLRKRYFTGVVGTGKRTRKKAT